MQHGGMLRQATAEELEEVGPVREQFFLYAIGENTSILLQRPTGWETAW